MGLIGVSGWKGEGMERFTEKFKDGRNILRNGIADVFYIGFGRFFNGDAIDKLAEYEDLEEQGLLLRLPCKVGTKVYCIMASLKGIHPMIFTQSFDYSMIECFGKTVFLTQAEAEEVLEKK